MNSQIRFLPFFIILISLFIFLNTSNAFSEITVTDDAEENIKNQNYVFSQKGGMLYKRQMSIYLRTNDEWTGFSTFYIGYRYGVNQIFNFSFEFGASPIPHVYLVGFLTHFKFYESSKKKLFLGLRNRMGYKYQDSDFSNIVDEDYLILKRNGFYFAADITIAVRFGKPARHCFYYTIYPRLDIDFFDEDERLYVLFSPITIGYEVQFKKNRNISFAIECGYAFPIPWDSIEKGKWVNFPSLGNFGFYYKWG